MLNNGRISAPKCFPARGATGGRLIRTIFIVLVPLYQKVHPITQFAADGISLYVNNNSDTAIKDAVAWVSGDDRVTYDGRIIYIGDIPPGSARGAMEEFVVSTEMTQVESIDLPPLWVLEYTDPSGARVKTEVVGATSR